IQTLERDQEVDLEGVTQNKLAALPPAGEEAKQARWLTDQEPDIVMLDKVEDPVTARHLIGYAAEKRVYVGVRAGNATEAITAWRKVVGDDRLASGRLSMVIAGRVLRKLCGACKVGYAPDPNTLRKLNMSPETVDKLYQARTQPMKNDKGEIIPCEFCHELRFKGRTGVYEVMVVDDEARQVLATGGSANQLKAIFRKQKGKYLQEEALGIVQRGDTSVQEVLRVLKPADAPTAGGKAPPPPPPPAPVDAA
ncbi:MAG TPA: hypothetical protein VK324_11410, partial [Tepidisphaeraceae bacterium]|nr:hypothetical protein [Tepidisphaeraceae bacterium]